MQVFFHGKPHEVDANSPITSVRSAEASSQSTCIATTWSTVPTAHVQRRTRGLIEAINAFTAFAARVLGVPVIHVRSVLTRWR